MKNIEKDFSLEEYKLTKERIVKNEERRYQLLVLNITGFAAVFGFSDKIIDPLLPVVLLGILTVCSRAYSYQTRLQLFNVAYIIERYEEKMDSINLETGYSLWMTRRFQKKAPLMPKSITIFLQPYVILLMVSLIGGGILCFDWIYNLWQSNKNLLVIIYLFAIILGHLPVFMSIRTYREHGLPLFREWWRKYLVSKGEGKTI
jgi:hypothetical protein